jgi:RNA polymerase sigma-70 factor, ECF subfamily
VIATEVIPARKSSQDELYEEASSTYGPALERLAQAYETDADRRRDLLQEIHIALWRSFAGFEQHCSLRTWIYRVAHNVGATHVARRSRNRSQLLVGLEEFQSLPDPQAGQAAADRTMALNRLLEMIQKLKPLDRHVILSYLEGLDAASIGEITGLSARNVATKIHRTKTVLARLFQEGDPNNE